MKTIEELVNTSMSPTTDGKYVGIEIEFACGFKRVELAALIVLTDFADYVTLRGDGSIIAERRCNCYGIPSCKECNGDWTDWGHELRVLVKQSQVKRIISKVCAFLDEIGAYANPTCGLHVHLDMRNRNANKAFKNLLAIQHVLYGMNPENREHSDYCKTLVDNTDLSDFSKFDLDRYYGINGKALKKFGTIEVRMHSGTVGADEIINWVSLLTRAVDSKAYEAADIKSLRALRTKLHINAAVAEHVRKQLVKYKRPGRPKCAA